MNGETSGGNKFSNRHCQKQEEEEEEWRKQQQQQQQQQQEERHYRRPSDGLACCSSSASVNNNNNNDDDVEQQQQQQQRRKSSFLQQIDEARIKQEKFDNEHTNVRNNKNDGNESRRQQQQQQQRPSDGLISITNNEHEQTKRRQSSFLQQIDQARVKQEKFDNDQPQQTGNRTPMSPTHHHDVARRQSSFLEQIDEARMKQQNFDNNNNNINDDDDDTNNRESHIQQKLHEMDSEEPYHDNTSIMASLTGSNNSNDDIGNEIDNNSSNNNTNNNSLVVSSPGAYDGSNNGQQQPQQKGRLTTATTSFVSSYSTQSQHNNNNNNASSSIRMMISDDNNVQQQQQQQQQSTDSCGSIEERSMTINTSEKQHGLFNCNRRIVFIVVSIVCVVCIAVAVSVSLLLVSSLSSSSSPDSGNDVEKGTKSISPTTISPTTTPTTPLPTEPINFVERKKSIISILNSKSVLDDDGSSIDASTPQGLALQWIVYNDTTMLSSSIINDDEPSSKLLQRYVLSVFFYSLSGPTWIDQYNWLNPAIDECQWEYISCDNNNTIVTEIEILDYNNVIGQLPSELSALSTSLRQIKIIRNAISLDIPHELSLLKDSLLTLHISINNNNNDDDTSYTIPSVVYELTALQSLVLSESYLIGTISSNISNLSNLQYLELGGGKTDHLFGTIPIELFNSPLMRLKEVTFCNSQTNNCDGSNNVNDEISGNNKLQGNITEIILALAATTTNQSSTTSIEVLDLSNNDIYGHIPTEIGLLNNTLHQLFISNNQISGVLPSEIGMLTNLNVFHIGNNNFAFESTLPEEICSLRCFCKTPSNSNNDINNGGEGKISNDGFMIDCHLQCPYNIDCCFPCM